MTEKRILALLAMLIGLIAGLLLLIRALDITRGGTSNLNVILDTVISALLGIAILVGSLMIYRSQYSSGGIINIVLGIVAIILPQGGQTAGILAIISGVLGLIASAPAR